MEFKYDFDYEDEEFGMPSYYEFNKQDKHDIVKEIENSNFTFTMPEKVEKGGRGFFDNLKNSKETKGITDVMKGTTTLGFVYSGGIIIAVDSRASMGSFMSSKTVRKCLEINDFLLGTLAGGAADCQYWLRKLNLWCKIFEYRYGERPSVSASANFLCNMISGYRGQGLSMGTMIAGWDNLGPQLYYVDDDGKCLLGKIFSAGSGSTYAFGVMDSKYRYDMTEEEAAKLGYESICHATYRDCGSGGFVRVYSIKKGCWKKLVDGDDVNQFHWNLARSMGLVGDGNETNNEKLKN